MFKKLIIPVIAVLAAVGFAFGTSNLKPAKKGTAFFKLKAQTDESSRTARLDPQKWEYAGTNPSTCSGVAHICVIEAVDNEGEPEIGMPGDQLYDILDNNGSDAIPAPDQSVLWNKTTP